MRDMSVLLGRITPRARQASAFDPERFLNRRGRLLRLAIPSSHRIGTDVLAERLEQHAIEPKLAPIAKLLDADGHRFVSRGGLWPIGAEQTVPPRQIETKIAVDR